jgi:hypothetical protein
MRTIFGQKNFKENLSNFLSLTLYFCFIIEKSSQRFDDISFCLKHYHDFFNLIHHGNFMSILFLIFLFILRTDTGFSLLFVLRVFEISFENLLIWQKFKKRVIFDILIIFILLQTLKNIFMIA